ncbi:MULTISPECIES: thermonuclease family protein [unclassified Rhizobium]|uniref:thermonuclease family protein n=1 Tax=unclassified Rhizobium TaxID=2613769 RepID=UPI00247A5E5C|nr:MULTISPECIES: thermonuclease family protein [unclassified Rhizobium]MDH7804036.1 endonuclease YncB(thermonuclease family) [Rhizobium sp. AN70]
MVRQVLILLFQIVLVVGLGIAGIRIASLVNGEAASTTAGLAANTEMLWTTAPVRVDPRHQNYERIPTPPDPYPLKIYADQRLRVVSNNRFTFKGQEFRLARVEDIDRNRVCAGPDGRRYACGLNAFKALENRLRGKYLECRVLEEGDAARSVECRINGQDVRALLQ